MPDTRTRKPKSSAAPAALRPRPVALRCIDASLARLKALLGSGLQAQLRIGGAPLCVQISDPRTADAPSRESAVCLQTAAGPLHLSPARDLIRTLAAIDLPGEARSDPLHALRLEFAAQAMPAGWFDLFGASSVLADGAPGDPAGMQVTLTVLQPDARRALAATLQGSADALLRALSRPPWQRVHDPVSALPSDWTLNMPVVAGRTSMPLRTLRSLSPGDVVLVDQALFGPDGSGEVRFGSRSAFCELHPGNPAQLEITEWQDSSAHDTMHETMLSPFPDGDEPDALGEIPVTLSFELGTLELSLSQLQALEPGALLPLSGALPPQVNVLTGGRRIACGELVELDGRLGVEIQRIGALS